MNLVSYWVVGFSGARHLSQPEAVRGQIAKALQELKGIADGELVAISSAAIGSDLLFIDEANRLGIPRIAVLPFPEDYFFNEKDFPDPSERDAARNAVAEAADSEIIRIPRDREEATEAIWRHTAFADAGFKCVDECDVFIAVVEDEKSGKPGGTSEVVAYARARNRPLLTIDPETLQIKRENWKDRLDDPLTSELRDLPQLMLKPDDRGKYPTAGARQFAEWRKSFATPAQKQKLQIRSANSGVVILNALAASMTALAFVLLPPLGASKPLEHALELIAFTCVAIALGLLCWVVWAKPQARHADNRFAAEIGRSLLAVWNFPGAASRLLRSPPPAFAHLVKSLLLYHRFDPDRLRDLRGATLSTETVRELAENYANARVQNQINHYSPRYDDAKRLAGKLEGLSFVFSTTAVLSAAFLAYLALRHIENPLYRSISGMIKLIAAIGTPVAVSMLAIHEAKRREARYGEMCKMLGEYKERIAQAPSLDTLQDLVVDVEHLFLSENYEWWILAKENVAA